MMSPILGWHPGAGRPSMARSRAASDGDSPHGRCSMPKYLLIESRDPFDSNDTGFCADLAAQLAAAKNEVTVFLVQNGVLPARAGARSGEIAKLAGAGVSVL